MGGLKKHTQKERGHVQETNVERDRYVKSCEIVIQLGATTKVASCSSAWRIRNTRGVYVMHEAYT